MSKIALVVIYNHRYDKNIDVIESLYKSRFTNIYHLMPFYDGDRINVIPVYEKALYFQGFIAQGFNLFFKRDFEHYLFIADDLILNPVIDENNYQDCFNLDNHTSFIPHPIKLHELKHFWPRTREAIEYRIRTRGVEVQNELPSYEQAIQALLRFGLEIQPIKPHQIYKLPQKSPKALIKAILYEKGSLMNYFFGKILQWRYYLPYPMVGSYSDVFIVSSHSIKKFCHYCGVFAATRLHVEIAIPTSLCLSAEILVTEKNLKLQGRALWPDGWNRLHGENDLAKGELKELDRYNNSLTFLLENFPTGYLYLHPIKLSKWNIKK